MIDTNDCWLWAGQISSTGYGVYYLKIDGKWRHRFAHRLLYENMVGEIPKGLVLDHLCRVRRCVNPQHLEAVTDAVNIARGIGEAARNKVKTHCPQGHPLAEGYVDRKGYRKCPPCRVVQRKEVRYRHLRRMSRQYTVEPLGTIFVRSDKRIKDGLFLPTRDDGYYRCSEETLKNLALGCQAHQLPVQYGFSRNVLYWCNPLAVPNDTSQKPE